MNRKSFGRRLRFLFFRLRRLGKLKLFLGIIIAVGAFVFHLNIAARLANDEAGDSKIYEQLAQNLVVKGVFSTDTTDPRKPTIIRTPGYPLFLAGVYEINGPGNDAYVRVYQALLFFLTCIISGTIAYQWTERRERRGRAGFLTFALSAFCPFIIIYTATILSETLTMFLLAASVLAATTAIKSRRLVVSGAWWATAGILGGLNVLVRPDAGLFAFGIGLALMVSAFWGRRNFSARIKDRFWKGLVFSAAFLLPLVPWTIRNERVFGIFQPLAPRHAEMPGEFVPGGYYLWVRTWIDDAKYIDPLIWRLEIKRLNINDVPADSFNSEDERQQVAQLFYLYNNSDPEHPFTPPNKGESCDSDNNDNNDNASVNNEDDNSSNDNDDCKDDTDGKTAGDISNSDSTELNLKITPDVDAAFEQIANERIALHPWHYYLLLPAKRSASMWFDTHSDFYPFNGQLFPLTELDESLDQDLWLPLFAGIDLIYTILSLAGVLALLLITEARSRLWLFMALAVSLPRIMFFGTIENPEPRYLVELFVLAAILGGIFLAAIRFRHTNGSVAIEMNYGDPKG